MVTNALSFYRSKLILDGSNLFWNGTNDFRWMQIRFFWTCPRQFGPVQNDFYPSKMILRIQNYIGPIEGQGISSVYELSKSHNNVKNCFQLLTMFLPIFLAY